jgi:hypothetical protein
MKILSDCVNTNVLKRLHNLFGKMGVDTYIRIGFVENCN